MTVFETDLEKAEALDFSRPLDVHKWSDYREVNAAVNAIYTDLKNDPDFTGSENLKKKHIKVVILSLYVNWLANPELFTAYSRDKNSYKNASRYNRLHISYMTVAVVDALESRRYIEHHLGHYSRDGSRQSHMSRMRATDRLIKLIKDDHKVEAKAVHTYQGTECIILRDWIEDKKGELRKTAIEYEDTRETQRMRKQLEKYNKLINASVIEIPGLDGEYVTGVNRISGYLVNYPENFVRRIFNNSKWSDGGRFYGGWWQRIPGELRRRIVINNSGNTCSELDYSGLHIVLLYAQENIDYWKDGQVDPYTLDGYETSERMRQLLKLVLLVAINVASRESARRAIQSEINDDQETYGWLKTEDIKLLDIIDAFAECHHPIQHHFFSRSGVRLQNIDGKIAEHVINHFTDKDIVTLCIHDSFLIDALYENELNQVMNEAFSKVLKGYTNTDAIITSLMKHQSMYSDLLKE